MLSLVSEDFGTTDSLLLLAHYLQSSLDKRAESQNVSLDFSSAFDSVNHQGLLYKLKSMGVGESAFNIFKDVLTNSQQRVRLI